MKQLYTLKKRFVFFTGLFFMLTAFITGNAQQSYTFTNASATGSTGPSQTQVTNAYQSTNLSGQVTATNGIQYWVVPSGVTNVRIETYGAQGGGGGTTGGLGARMRGDFTVTPGSTLKILVGQMGATGSNHGGGGGGTYVTLLNNTPLCIAGGGGGSYYNTYSGLAVNMSGTVSGTARDGVQGNNSNAAGVGGSGGSGGGVYSGYSPDEQGTGGGGLTTDGASAGSNTGGKSFVNGGQGGVGINNSPGQSGYGGFGGGGGGDWSNWTGAGGGGGYSGGGGGTYYGAGGGGGSYNNGTNQSNSSGVNSGHGKVIIRELCNITLSVTGVNSSSAMCSGNSVTLTTNAISNYSWSTGATSSSIVVSPGSTAIYSLTATSPANCDTSAFVTVVVNSAAPVLSVNSSTNSTCLGKSVALTASGAIIYSWTAGVVNGVAFTPTITQTYTVTGTNGCGSTNSSITITVAPLPVGISATNTQVCQFQPVTLNAAGATTYTWMPGNLTQQSVIVAPGANTIYTVTASDGTCSGTATVAIATNPNPTIMVVASSSNICAGESVTLTANGANTYTWSDPTINGSTGVVTPSIPIVYQVTGSNQFNCVTSAAQVVVVKAAPVITAKASHSLVCNGNSSTLTVSGNANSYLWTNGSTSTLTVVSPNTASSYTVTGTDSNTGCKSSQMVTVNVFQAILPASPSATICEGASITLTAGVGTNYQWSPVASGFPNVTVKPLVPTTYTVSAFTTSSNVQCLSSNTIHVGLYSLPVVTASASRTVMCRSKESVELTASGAPNFVWINNNNNTNATIIFTTNLIQTHNLSVVGTDENGCKDTAVVVVRVDACTGISEFTHQSASIVVYPNPNNGSFTVKASGSIRLELMNELGQVVKVLTLDAENDFSANLEGVSAGVYFLTGHSNDQRINEKVIITR